MRTDQTAPTTIDEYIAGFPPEVQEILEKVRATIREAAPGAEETIKYRIPTFTLKGNLVHFAAFKKHIGFYPTPTGIEQFKDELSVYEGAKGSVQFRLDKPIPFDLIRRIVEFRVRETLERAQSKAKKKYRVISPTQSRRNRWTVARAARPPSLMPFSGSPRQKGMHLAHMIRIREARSDDSAGLATVQVDSYRAAYASLLPQDYLAHFSYEEQEQDWRDWVSSHPRDVLYVAENDSGEIVGYALGRPGSSDITPYDSELVALHVRHLHQRQGIGRQLVTTLARRLMQQGCSSLMLWVAEKNSSRLFYERLGGVLIGERTVQLGEGDIRLAEVAYGWPNIGSLCGSSAP